MFNEGDVMFLYTTSEREAKSTKIEPIEPFATTEKLSARVTFAEKKIMQTNQ